MRRKKCTGFQDIFYYIYIELRIAFISISTPILESIKSRINHNMRDKASVNNVYAYAISLIHIYIIYVKSELLNHPIMIPTTPIMSPKRRM